MQAIVPDNIDDSPHPFAKRARVERKEGAYQEKNDV
jgi:hypothetical protein